MIVARLIENGVFEHDKSIRNIFRDRLTPIAASPYMECISPLQQTKSPASLNWLIDLLINHVNTRLPHDAIGAGRLLFLKLGDSDPRLATYLHWLKNTAINIQEQVLAALDLQSETEDLANWQVEYISTILQADQFTKPPHMLLFFLVHGGETRWATQVERDLRKRTSNEAADLFRAILMRRVEPGRIDFQTHEYGWATARTLAPHGFAIPPFTELAQRVRPIKLSGAIEYARNLLTWAIFQDQASLKYILNRIRDDWDLLNVAPYQIQSCVPIPSSLETSPTRVMNELAALSSEDFAISLREHRIGRIPLRRHVGLDVSLNQASRNSGTPSDFVKLANDYPAAALSIWTKRHAYPTEQQERLDHPDCLEAIALTINNNPEVILERRTG
ncbi:hypothetical protein ACN469_12855 [Corallococcus terminator]